MARVRKTTKMVMLERVMMVMVMLMTIFVMIMELVMVMLIRSFYVHKDDKEVATEGPTLRLLEYKHKHPGSNLVWKPMEGHRPLSKEQ